MAVSSTCGMRRGKRRTCGSTPTRLLLKSAPYMHSLHKRVPSVEWGFSTRHLEHRMRSHCAHWRRLRKKENGTSQPVADGGGKGQGSKIHSNRRNNGSPKRL